MGNIIKEIYENHHRENRVSGFSIMKEERSNLLRKLIGQNKNILDIGCRDGALTKIFCENNKVVGVDIDEVALMKVKEDLGIEIIAMDLNDSWQKLKNNTFDVIFAGEVLEHLYYPEKIIKKVSEHLVDDGIFIGSVPNAFSLKNRIRYLFGKKKNTPLEDPTHINHFSMNELDILLRNYFQEIEFFPLGNKSKFDKFWPGMFSFSLFFTASKKNRK